MLVTLYEEPEKPNDALDFLKQHLHGGSPETSDVEALRLENAELKQKNDALQEEVNELKTKVDVTFMAIISLKNFCQICDTVWYDNCPNPWHIFAFTACRIWE